MKLLHVNITGYTATFRIPTLYSGVGLTITVPPYSTILGLIGNISGREIQHNETKVGYIFRGEGKAVDLETSHRMMLKNNVLKENPKTSVARREFISLPTLDLYLDNLEFKHSFEYPENTPYLGRSQDVCCINKVEILDAIPISGGVLRGTLIPFCLIPGIILNLPDYISNSNLGYVRKVGKWRRYIVVKYDTPVNISRDNLYKVGNDVIFMNTL